MGPTSAALIAKAAIAAGSDKRIWTGIASLIVVLCLPLILGTVCVLNIAAAGAEHNRAAVNLAFESGDISGNLPEDYDTYISKMRESFGKLDAVLTEVEELAEGKPPERIWVKSVFYSLYFGSDWLWMSEADYRRFVDCFIEYEERIRVVENEDGNETEETYTVAIPITEKTECFAKLARDYGKAATYEQQANAVNVWHLVEYGSTALQEGDEFADWGGWSAGGEVSCFDSPASRVGGKVLEFAMSRLGNPYSQSLPRKGKLRGLQLSDHVVL